MHGPRAGSSVPLEDLVYLVTKGKTAKTGEIFGDIVASRLMKKGLVHIECTGKNGLLLG